MDVIDFYNNFYLKAESSKAHAALCEKVYGRDLCQHGMADMFQIEQLIKTMNLNCNSRLLDLGCGIGFITEYIQAETDSIVTGLDFSITAIEKAKERTANKSSKLSFVIGDMNNLQYQKNTFDAISSIDTHYFVKDFEKFLDKAMEIIVPGGQICIFSDQGSGIPRDDSQLQPEESKIGLLLQRKGILFKAINFTVRNKEHWRLKAKVVKELEEEFRIEDNLFLYNNRLDECIKMNRDLDCRFLFQLIKK